MALALFAATSLLAGLYAYLYDQKRTPYLSAWTIGWAFLALHYLGPGLSRWISTGPLYTSLNRWVYVLSGVAFFLGAQLYAKSKPWIFPATVVTAVLFLWALVNRFASTSVFGTIPSSLILFAVATVFWHKRSDLETLTDSLLALSFSAWAIIQLSISLLFSKSETQGAATQPIVTIPIALVATLFIVASYEDEKRRTERNMLALSNLNLATSSFVGAELQRMLSQALVRVLGIVSLPAGALFLHHGEPQGPTSVVAEGLSDHFCRTTQDEDLDEYLINMVTHLGGLVGFRDLLDDSLGAFPNDESFRRFREVALSEGLRSVVFIGIQAKQQAFGVLLLGTVENRRFTPAELRLLLALGHQIGMAIENSYLLQQTARRSEELHVLNEIGRALSSTLNKEDLLRKIWEELRRLFDVENFYIASIDPLRDEMHFDLDMKDGVRVPSRSRPVGNHLTEYIIRTRQPVLIRDNYVAEVRKLGVEPIRTRGCFCGVPLVAYDHAIGAMAVFSDQERVFDEGHLELLRVLASEASIAIENARLFHEERTKARHLALLNTISRNAIATLNPDEMLAKIAEQLEDGLNYDHIGIGVLDYATREIVIQAEAGERRGVLGQRVPLGTRLIGQVARNGHMAVSRAAASPDNMLKPILPDSVVAIALPIFYAEQLHGILYAESSQPVDFSEEEVLLLRTLADLIAGVLHNALTFQKAQEQAITDGLTGLRIHRFFMESLSAECKRARSTKGQFNLVLIDLDHFKNVNDTLGHLEGDAVLRRVANILGSISPKGSTVARLGGDEFAVLFSCVDPPSVRDFAEQIRTALLDDELLKDRGVTASIGVAAFPKNGTVPNDLIEAADSAMYKSKHGGRNKVSMPSDPM